LGCLTPGGAIGADETVRCDLGSCIDIAMANHPALKAGAAREAMAQAGLAAEKAARNPHLSLEGGVGYFAGESLAPFALIRDFTEEGFRQRSASGEFYRTMVGLEIPLYQEGAFWGRTSPAMRQAELGVSEEEWRTKALRRKVSTEVAAAYGQALKGRLAVQANEEIVALQQKDYDLARARATQDLLSRKDLLMADVRLAAAKRDLAAAQSAFRQGSSALSRALGLTAGQTVEVEDMDADTAAAVPSLEELTACGLASDPAIKTQQMQVEGQAAAVDKLRSARYPTVALVTHYGLADDFDSDVDDQFKAELGITIPIFDFGLIRQRVAAAQAQAMASEQELRALQAAVAAEIEESFYRAQDFDQYLELLAKQVEQAEETVKLYRSQVEQGTVATSELHEAEAALLRLQVEERGAQYDLAQARLQLQELCGG